MWTDEWAKEGKANFKSENRAISCRDVRFCAWKKVIKITICAFSASQGDSMPQI